MGRRRVGSQARARGAIVLEQEGRCALARIRRLDQNRVGEPRIGDNGSRLIVFAGVKDRTTATDYGSLAESIGESETRSKKLIVEVVGITALPIDPRERDYARSSRDRVDLGGIE